MAGKKAGSVDDSGGSTAGIRLAQLNAWLRRVTESEISRRSRRWVEQQAVLEQLRRRPAHAAAIEEETLERPLTPFAACLDRAVSALPPASSLLVRLRMRHVPPSYEEIADYLNASPDERAALGLTTPQTPGGLRERYRRAKRDLRALGRVMLLPDDLPDPVGLAVHLRDGGPPPLTGHLAGLCPAKLWEALDRCGLPDPPQDALDHLAETLAEALNEVLFGPCLYDVPSRFEGVAIGAATVALATRRPPVVGVKRVRLNRHLLELAYSWFVRRSGAGPDA